MNALVAEAQLCREARRVFRKLIADGAYLIADGGDAYALIPAPGAKRKSLSVEGRIVAGFLARDWLRPRGTVPESFALSDAGTGWYLRTLAPNDPFAAQHQARRDLVLETAEGRRRVVVNEGESPLGWLRRRRLIDPSQFAAGEKLRRDFTLAQLSPRLGVDYSAALSPGRRGAKPEAVLAETVLAAKQRFRAAMIAVGPGLADVLFDICCHLIGLEEVERGKDWPRRSAKVVLDIALDRLATHYGLRVTARAHARTRAWSAEDGG